MRIKIHDIHIHTTLSLCCRDPQATPENYLELAVRRGLTSMGFSNHFWDSCIPGASDWYRIQDFDHISQLKPAFPREDAEKAGIRLLFGCETEYAAGTLGMDPKRISSFDYVLIPHTHMHMKGFVIPETLTEPNDLAAFMIQTYREVVRLRLDVPTSIAHPFIAIGYPTEIQMELLERISDAAFRESFSIAAENRVGLELNTACLPLLPEYPGFRGHPMTRMYALAKECGVKFTMGSDAHSLSETETILQAPRFFQECGITEEDLMDFVR